MNKKSAVVATVLVLLAIVNMFLFTPVSGESVTILSSSGWLTKYGLYILVGEVQNTDSATACSVRLSATFYDSKNTILDSAGLLVQLDALQPGAKSPFYLSISSSNPTLNASQIDHYDIQVISIEKLSDAQVKPNGLHILSNRLYTDSFGYKHVDGEIQNIGTEESTGTKIFVTLYDSSGKVVDMNVKSPDMAHNNSYPENINPGGIATFSWAGVDKSRAPLFSSYSLTAQSENYGLVSADLSQSPIPIQPSPTPSVPEFAIPAVLLLFAVIPLIATILLRKNNCAKAYN